MRKLTETEQRATNGGWCFKTTLYLGTKGSHYVNGVFQHTDYYQKKSGSWYYYG